MPLVCLPGMQREASSHHQPLQGLPAPSQTHHRALLRVYPVRCEGEVQSLLNADTITREMAFILL